MGKLEGRVAVVTGGAQGMGEAHCRLLAFEGAEVVVCDVRNEEGTAVADSIGGVYHRLDVADEAGWDRVVGSVAADLGPITILINNAGVGVHRMVQETTTEEWERVMSINVTGPFFGIRAVAPGMKAAGGGVIVNVSSSAAFLPSSHIGVYATSKWAVRGLTKAAALDLAPDGIRVCSLHPGMVRTPMNAKVDVDSLARSIPISRVGDSDELAKMMLFIVADATYSTGVEFIADGGFTVGTPTLDTI